jgi:hypothetical protein
MTIPSDESDDEGRRRAVRLHVMLNSLGYSDVEVNDWWRTPSNELDGETPTFIWLRHREGDREKVEEMAGKMPARNEEI